LAQTLGFGNNAGGTGIDMNYQTISNVPTISNTGALGGNMTLIPGSTGAVIVSSGSSGPTGAFVVTNNQNGGFGPNPTMQLINTNGVTGATGGVPSIEYYKTGTNVAQNNYIASQNFYANDYQGLKTEFGRLTYQATNSSAGGGNDGALGVWCSVNGNVQQVMLFNGADNENNSFRPIDLNGNALRTSALSMDINAASSTGNGQISITPKPLAVGSTGTLFMFNLPTSSAGLSSGAVWRNGTVLNIVP
jgi:hypothetical protein